MSDLGVEAKEMLESLNLSSGAREMLEGHPEYNEADLKIGSMDRDGIFAIYDYCAGVYFTPFVMDSAALAMRCFSDYCIVPDTSIFKHPEDYSLFQLGEYSKKTGKLYSFACPCLLLRASSVIYEMKQKLSSVKEPEKSSVTEDNTDLSVKEVGEDE